MTVNDYNQAVRLYSDRLFRYVLKNIKSIHMAEDIVQESFEKLWKNVKNVDGDKVKSYLFKTAHNTMIDYIRKDKRFVNTEEPKMPEASYDNNYSDLGVILQDAVNRLPEIQRMVLLLRDYEGYSYQEIGEITGLNESQVKVYIYRARIYLRNYIGNPEAVI